MAKNEIKIITGKVKYCGKNNDGKNTVSVFITPEQAEKITKGLGLKGFEDGVESNPIKISDDGELTFKAYSKFDVIVYDNGIEQFTENEGDIHFTKIGQDSEVQISIVLKEITYQRKKYQVAYLQSINVLDYIPFERFNAFDSADVEEF